MRGGARGTKASRSRRGGLPGITTRSKGNEEGSRHQHTQLLQQRRANRAGEAGSRHQHTQLHQQRRGNRVGEADGEVTELSAHRMNEVTKLSAHRMNEGGGRGGGREGEGRGEGRGRVLGNPSFRFDKTGPTQKYCVMCTTSCLEETCGAMSPASETLKAKIRCRRFSKHQAPHQ